MTAKRRDRRFCSESCAQKASYKRGKGAELQAARANMTCGYCGESFTARRSDAKYCSATCRSKAYQRDNRAELSAKATARARANPEARKRTLERFAERHPDHGKERYAQLKADPERRAAEQMRTRQYYEEHREEVIERTRQRYERDPAKRYDYQHGCDWKKLIAQLWEAQDGKCYLCGDPLDRSKRLGVQLDHDHSCCPTGRTCEKCRRGLCCNRCNTLIAWAMDDPERMHRIASNLEVAKALVRQRMENAA